MGNVLRLLRGLGFGSIVMVAMALGCRPHKADTVAATPAPQITAFLQHLEAGVGTTEAEMAEAAGAAARRYHIPTPPPPDVWQELLVRSQTSGWRARPALLTLAAKWGEPFLTQAFGIYAAHTDVYTEGCLLQLLIDEMPQDRRTAQYALSLVGRLYGAKWPDDFDLHGMTPFGAAVMDLLPQIWTVPEHVMRADDCGTAMLVWTRATSGFPQAWRFDAESKKWTTGPL